MDDPSSVLPPPAGAALPPPAADEAGLARLMLAATSRAPTRHYADLPAADRAIFDQVVAAWPGHGPALGGALETVVGSLPGQQAVLLADAQRYALDRAVAAGSPEPVVDRLRATALDPLLVSVLALVLPAGEAGQRWSCQSATLAWLRSRRSAHTRRAYFRDLAGWLSWLAARDLDPRDARRGDLDTYLTAAGDDRPAAASTVNRRLSTLSSWYGYLVDHDLAARNPVTAVDRPPLNRDFSPTVGLTVAEVRALLRAAAAVVERRADNGGPTRSARRDHVLLALIAGLGLRVGEATGLDLADVRHNTGHRTVLIRGKGGRTRELPVPTGLRRLLEEHLLEQRRETAAERGRHQYRPQLSAERAAMVRDLDCGILPATAVDRGWRASSVWADLASEDGDDADGGTPLLPSATAYADLLIAASEASDAQLEQQVPHGPLFTTGTGNRLTQAAVFATVRRLARAAGLPAAEQISPHSLRHAAATAALNDGAPLRDVQDFLGHADPRTTRRYDRNRGSLDRSPAYRLGLLYAE